LRQVRRTTGVFGLRAKPGRQCRPHPRNLGRHVGLGAEQLAKGEPGSRDGCKRVACENVQAVAWVPEDDPDLDWDLAIAIAVEWIEERCREEGAPGLLVTPSLSPIGPSTLEDFARRHRRTSRRSRRPQAAGPVLCVTATAEDLEFATHLARRSSLAVLESSFFPLRGWAAWLGARNLATGEATPKLPATIRDAVERLKYYGNNAFAERFGKDRARSIVGELRGRGDFDRDLVLGAVLAAGVSAHGVNNLAALIDRVR